MPPSDLIDKRAEVKGAGIGDAPGVFGAGQDGPGVYGDSLSDAGVEGHSYDAGPGVRAVVDSSGNDAPVAGLEVVARVQPGDQAADGFGVTIPLKVQAADGSLVEVGRIEAALDDVAGKIGHVGFVVAGHEVSRFGGGASGVRTIAVPFDLTSPGFVGVDAKQSIALPTIDNLPVPATADVALDAVLGLITAGTHSWKLQWINAAGHSLPSAVKSAVLTSVPADHGQVDITIPTFPAGATGCNVYRTKAGDAGSYYLVNASPILAAGVYTDNIADAALGGAVAGTDTSGGTFTLDFGDGATAAIAWDALEAAIQAALDAVTPGVTKVVGNCPTFTVELIGTAGSDADITPFVADGTSLTASPTTITVAIISAGSAPVGLPLADVQAGDLLLAAFLEIDHHFDGTTPGIAVLTGVGTSTLFGAALGTASTDGGNGFAALTAVTGAIGAFLVAASLTAVLGTFSGSFAAGNPLSTVGSGVLYLVIGTGAGQEITIEAGI